jgi:hypothetical protein
VAVPAAGQTVAPDETLWREFLTPPAEAKPMMRWWWFGPSVVPNELDREIRAMKAAGFGGFEVQPVYPLSPDGAPDGLRNLPYLSDGFIAALRHAARTARAEGMRIDVTGGSGWPFGGPHVPVTQAAANIRMERVSVPAGAKELLLPATGPGEAIVAATLGPLGAPGERFATAGPRVTIAAADAPREALVFITGRTGQQVKRPAIGAEGYVLDHIDPAAIANHLTTVGDRLLEAFADGSPPYAVFSDSLEAYGSSWTGDLPAEFRRRRGYDLLDHLPALFLDTPESAAVRFDWARTLSELVDERYLKTIDGWAKDRGTRFRAQVYGFPPPTLSSNALVALPEGEGQDWRSFTSTRWATSGAHLYGKPVVSSEVWTWLHSPSWAATPLDMKMEADRHFLQGVTQLVGHGWPYTPSGVTEPGWAFYAAAALNDHNPWFGVMPDVARYLQRVSHMLRQGEPANRVAVYLPIEDAFAAMQPDKASVNEAMHQRIPDSLLARILDGGYNFDFIDAGAVRAGRIRHDVLVLPPMERIDADTYAVIERWVKGGGRVIAIDGLPRTAGGKLENKAREAVARLSRRMASTGGVVVTAEADLTGALAAAAAPDMQLASADPAIGFVRRKLTDGDVYFVANTGNRPIRTSARFAGDRGNGSWWDPLTGRRWPAGSGDIALTLAPYESRLLAFVGTRAVSAPSAIVEPQTRPLATGWRLRIADRAEQPLTAFGSWADREGLRHFSGTATYSLTLRLDRLGQDRCVALDFGAPTPRQLPRGARHQAAIDAPLRDAAVVIVNGSRAGSLWAPPYRLDISRWLKSGTNRIEIAVSNTALNLLSGRAEPDYRLLHLRYGERFQPQDTDGVVPQPSGLLQPPALIESARESGQCGG